MAADLPLVDEEFETSFKLVELEVRVARIGRLYEYVARSAGHLFDARTFVLTWLMDEAIARGSDPGMLLAWFEEQGFVERVIEALEETA